MVPSNLRISALSVLYHLRTHRIAMNIDLLLPYLVLGLLFGLLLLLLFGLHPVPKTPS
jgi:hypothetical protein